MSIVTSLGHNDCISWPRCLLRCRPTLRAVLAQLCTNERRLVKSSYAQRVRDTVAQISVAGWVALAVTLLGLILRIEHAYTFDGPGRGSDYASNVQGVRWMLKNMRPFDFTGEVGWSVKYQPPLWSAVGALILKLTNSERAIAYVAVFGWTIRQWLLARIMKQMAPHRGWSRVAALSINAVLPISVLTDGKVNPENYHSTLFTIAVYFLWRIERQTQGAGGISWVTAALFGLFAGLSILTKGTASVLLIVAAIVLFWQTRRLLAQISWAAIRRRLLSQPQWRPSCGVWLRAGGYGLTFSSTIIPFRILGIPIRPNKNRRWRYRFSIGDRSVGPFLSSGRSTLSFPSTETANALDLISGQLPWPALGRIGITAVFADSRGAPQPPMCGEVGR